MIHYTDDCGDELKINGDEEDDDNDDGIEADPR